MQFHKNKYPSAIMEGMGLLYTIIDTALICGALLYGAMTSNEIQEEHPNRRPPSTLETTEE
tara:strand:- start:159 stop:341 length:183 start_codon:yes stop_codon:yes gene_type:complete